MPDLTGKKLKQIIDPTLAKAFTHPLRGHVWVTLFEQGTVSPSQIANELGLDPSDVSYHFDELRRRGLIRLVRTVKRRGFSEHFYEPIAPAFHFDDSEWMDLPEGVRETFSGEMIQQIIQRLVAALGAGSFDARDRHLSQTWLLVDEHGWEELTRALRQTLERVLAIQQRCAERCKESSTAPRIPVSVLLAAFETAASISRGKAGETEAL